MADIKQFAITFFNLKLWKEDKGHNSTRTEKLARWKVPSV